MLPIIIAIMSLVVRWRWTLWAVAPLLIPRIGTPKYFTRLDERSNEMNEYAFIFWKFQDQSAAIDKNVQNHIFNTLRIFIALRSIFYYNKFFFFVFIRRLCVRCDFFHEHPIAANVEWKRNAQTEWTTQKINSKL